MKRIKLRLSTRALEPQGMTMRQLAQFVTDAEAAGIGWDEHPKVQVGWRAQIKNIEVSNNQEWSAGNE